jgi:DNA polymerase sigma
MLIEEPDREKKSFSHIIARNLILTQSDTKICVYMSRRVNGKSITIYSLLIAVFKAIKIPLCFNRF